MNTLLRIFGWPHELLHVLALRLIGRRPHAVQQSHVDIPDDLSTGEYVFVAGLPALVFTLGLILGVQLLLTATGLPQLGVGLALAAVFAIATLGTIGDVFLIIERIVQARVPKDYD